MIELLPTPKEKKVNSITVNAEDWQALTSYAQEVLVETFKEMVQYKDIQTLSTKEVADLFGVSRPTLYYWKRKSPAIHAVLEQNKLLLSDVLFLFSSDTVQKKRGMIIGIITRFASKIEGKKRSRHYTRRSLLAGDTQNTIAEDVARQAMGINLDFFVEAEDKILTEIEKQEKIVEQMQTLHVLPKYEAPTAKAISNSVRTWNRKRKKKPIGYKKTKPQLGK